MFDIGFSEILLIFVIALVVLGPEKLPRLASQVGRWVGRARAMARQFREQLEEEVNLEQVRKAQEQKKPADSATSSEPQAGATTGPEPSATASTSTANQASDSTTIVSDPASFHADTFSHAHPTDEYGANPYTPNGAAEAPPASPSPASEPQSSHPSEPDGRPPEVSSRTADSDRAAEMSPAAAPSPNDANSRQRRASGDVHASTAPSPHNPDGLTANSTQQPGNAGADPHGPV